MGNVVLTVIGDDRSGLVHALAEVIARQGGNWEQSRFVQLAGKFAGVLEVALPDADTDALVADLRSLDGTLDVTVHRAGPVSTTPDPLAFHLDLVGADHPGIVEKVTEVLTGAGVNVATLTTETRAAPWVAERLFAAQALLQAPAGADLGALSARLEELAKDLMVDITVGDVEAAVENAESAAFES